MTFVGSLWASLFTALCRCVWLCKVALQRTAAANSNSHSQPKTATSEGKQNRTGAGGEVTLQKCISCSTWTIFARSRGPRGLWNSPSIPCTKISAKTQQTVLHPKLFCSNTHRVALLTSSATVQENESHVWVQPPEDHPKGRSGPYVVRRISASWRKSQAALPSSPAIYF